MGLNANDWAGIIGAFGHAAGGYQRGLATYEDREQKKRQAELDAQEQELRIDAAKQRRAQEKQAWELRQGMANQLDQEVLDPAAVPRAGGMSAPSAAMLQRGNSGYGVGAGAVQEAAGDYDREMIRGGMANPGTGAATTGLPTKKYGDRELNSDRKKLALLTNDNAGLDSALAREKGFRIEDAVKDAQAKFRADPDGHIGRLTKQLNADGITAMVAGKPGKDGYRTLLVGEQGKEVRLSPQQAEVAAIGAAIMEHDWEKGIAMLNTVSKDLVAEITRQSGQAKDVVQTANQSQHFATQDSVARQRLNVARAGESRAALAERKYNEQQAVAQQAMGLRMGFEEARRSGNRPAQDIYAREYEGLRVRGVGAGVNLPPLGERAPFKFQSDGQGGGVYHDESGRPVGQLDRQYGLVPFGPDPRQDKDAVVKMKAGGVTPVVVPDEQNGMPMWGYESQDGRRWTSVAEAIKANVEAAHAQRTGGGRGSVNPPAAAQPPVRGLAPNPGIGQRPGLQVMGDWINSGRPGPSSPLIDVEAMRR